MIGGLPAITSHLSVVRRCLKHHALARQTFALHLKNDLTRPLALFNNHHQLPAEDPHHRLVQ